MSTLLFDRRGASDPLSQSRTLDVPNMRYGLERRQKGTEALKKLWQWFWPKWPTNPNKEVDSILEAHRTSQINRLIDLRYNGGAVPLRSLTREQWAKHRWVEVTMHGDDSRMYVKAMERDPTEAKQAWDEFEIFQKLGSGVF